MREWSADFSPPSSSLQDEPTETPTLFETFLTIRDVDHAYHLANTQELQQQLFAGDPLRHIVLHDLRVDGGATLDM